MMFREAGDSKCAKPYLPRDKQFLITRNGTGLGNRLDFQRHRLGAIIRVAAPV